MKDICNAHYRHSKRVCKEVEIKHLREYHDLYLQGNTLMYWTTFEICLNIFKLDPAKVLSIPQLAW